jgi:hypothetical protein
MIKDKFTLQWEAYNKGYIVWELLLDSNRTNSYTKFIRENVKDKIVVECGAGTGYFSWLCAKYGAKKVYSCEQSINLCNDLKERFSDIDNIEVVHCDVFKDNLPKGDIYIHELFGHTATGEGMYYFLHNCRRQNIKEIFPKYLNLVSCDFETIPNKIPVSLDTFDDSNVEDDLKDFLKLNNKEIDPKQCLYNYTYKINYASKKDMFRGELLDILQLGLAINPDKHFTYFEAGFDKENFYSSFAKKQNHWEIDKQKTHYYKQNSMEYVREINEF